MRRAQGGLILAALVLLGPRPGPGEEPKPESPGEKVARFAREHKGQQVGRGECAELADEALKAAGARRFPPHGADADYVWGEPVEPLERVRPGDILQLRDAVFAGRERLASGAIRTWSMSFPHHTAVVTNVRKTRAGVVLTILHQNFGSSKDEARRRRVQEGHLTLKALQPGGFVRAYRPVADGEG